jgi:hypothetical protein
MGVSLGAGVAPAGEAVGVADGVPSEVAGTVGAAEAAGVADDGGTAGAAVVAGAVGVAMIAGVGDGTGVGEADGGDAAGDAMPRSATSATVSTWMNIT